MNIWGVQKLQEFSLRLGVQTIVLQIYGKTFV